MIHQSRSAEVVVTGDSGTAHVPFVIFLLIRELCILVYR